ncbi:LptF/LptG family permease [uncultured Psychroserpens sp.]|uniref:LptF/LptG family permease n=1 Tax=uncultured Psychroserpens sp. TaxID=255436 RepID=UPI002620387B|nr:LptF/LptG family permease [uncultured Psychroserpens sp.]
MKILDRYILTTYLKTFLSVFIILMFIFVLQAIWLYIGDLAGKDLDTFIILKLLLYITPTLIPLILPLTILLVSIMVFGQFAENYEFAAMKSTGISLQRAMRSLSIFIVLLGVTTFIFSNNVIPWANYRVYNLRKNIAQVKPALAITKGQFNDIGNYNIKVQDKSGDNDQFLTNVVIHKKNKNGKNKTVIVSESGELRSSEGSNILQLVLYNGNYYEEIFTRNPRQSQKRPHAKSYFEEYTINVDLEGLNDVDINDKSYESRYNMLDVAELNHTIDSLYDKRDETRKNFANALYNRTSIPTLNNNMSPKKDSIFSGDILSLFSDKTKNQILNLSKNTINSTKQIIDTNKQNFLINTKWRNKHVQSLHEKYVLGLACIILFFVGAPLGALIRKGGIGLPLVVAILLFLTYHFIGIFARNSSLDDSLNPVLATWLSTAIMFPLSIYLTNRATKDRPLFESEGILEQLKKLFGIKRKTLTYNTALLDTGSEAYTTLSALDDKKLIDVVKHYRQYDYGIEYKNSSLEILNSRGITEQELKFGGNLTDHSYEESLRLKYSYEENSKLAFVLYLIALVLTLPGAILRNNGYPVIGQAILVTGIIVGIFYLFALIKSFIDYSNLNKQLGKKSISNAVMFLFLGLPLYTLFYFLQKKKINEDLKVNTVKESTNTSKHNVANSHQHSISKRKDYDTYSRFALIFFCVALVLLLTYFGFKSSDLSAVTTAALELFMISTLLFIIYAIASSLSFNRLYHEGHHLDNSQNMQWTIISFIAYPYVYVLRRNKIAKDFSA